MTDEEWMEGILYHGDRKTLARVFTVKAELLAACKVLTRFIRDDLCFQYQDGHWEIAIREDDDITAEVEDTLNPALALIARCEKETL